MHRDIEISEIGQNIEGLPSLEALGTGHDKGGWAFLPDTRGPKIPKARYRHIQQLGMPTTKHLGHARQYRGHTPASTPNVRPVSGRMPNLLARGAGTSAQHGIVVLLEEAFLQVERTTSDVS